MLISDTSVCNQSENCFMLAMNTTRCFSSGRTLKCLKKNHLRFTSLIAWFRRLITIWFILISLREVYSYISRPISIVPEWQWLDIKYGIKITMKPPWVLTAVELFVIGYITYLYRKFLIFLCIHSEMSVFLEGGNWFRFCKRRCTDSGEILIYGNVQGSPHTDLGCQFILFSLLAKTAKINWKKCRDFFVLWETEQREKSRDSLWSFVFVFVLFLSINVQRALVESLDLFILIIIMYKSL